MTVYFVRHGRVYDPDNIFYGRLPGYRLSSEGQEEVEYTARQLTRLPITAVYHSPLLRAQQTAEIIARELAVGLQSDDRLIEVGTYFEGKSREHLLQYPPVASDFTETMEQIYQRMADFLRDKAQQHPGGSIVAVSHGGPIRLLEMGLLNQPFTSHGYALETVPACASVTAVTIKGDNWSVERLSL